MGSDFLAEYQATLGRILAAPERWRKIRGDNRKHPDHSLAEMISRDRVNKQEKWTEHLAAGSEALVKHLEGNASIGRWPSRDPISELGARNL